MQTLSLVTKVLDFKEENSELIGFQLIFQSVYSIPENAKDFT